jgi:hypothetical protein
MRTGGSTCSAKSVLAYDVRAQLMSLPTVPRRCLCPDNRRLCALALRIYTLHLQPLWPPKMRKAQHQIEGDTARLNLAHRRLAEHDIIVPNMSIRLSCYGEPASIP